MKPRQTTDAGQPPFSQRLGVRLAALLALGAVTSAMLAMAAMLAIAWFDADHDSSEEAHQVARSVAFALQAPVSFADAQGIKDALAVLRTRPQIQGAWVHDAAERLLHAMGDGLPPPRQAAPGGLAQGWLQVSAPIIAGSAGDTVGRVTLLVSLEGVQRKLRSQAWAAAAASLVAALLALVVSQRLARRISVPVVRLAQTAAKISHEQNYALRLPSTGRDEVGIAVDAFNHMLAEIEQRGSTLMAVNQRLQHQVQLAAAAQALAESASLAKTRFLANMSHELRSPLNGVIGAAQLLQAQGGDAGRRAELVGMIRTSGSNLLGLIEHVLDLARIEAGALELTAQDFDVLDCVEAAVASSSALAATKGLQLSCHVDPRMELRRHGDEARLRQLLLNLLGNAVKFTSQGDVSIEVLPVEGVADRVRIQIRDTGIGISPAALRTVFEPFQQADASTTRRYGGSGLGLSICRDLAKLMGGEVTAESIAGVGSCFTLELPLPAAEQAIPQAPALELRVAWCEPHEPSAKALAALLQRLGCQAQRCHDLAALQAFLKVKDLRGRPSWFIVALDSELGRTLLAAALPRLDPCQVLAIDNASDGSQTHVRASLGLACPITRPLLRSTLVSSLSNGRSAATPAATPTDGLVDSSSPVQVLLVEDDTINQEVVRSMLAHAGFACTVARDGASALQQLEHTRFELVLMDWHMPDMDGLEATRRLRAGSAGELNRAVPVVALTANAFAEDRSACLAAGMDDFVTKPVLASHLVAVATRWAFRDRITDDAARAWDEGAAMVAPEEAAPAYDPSVMARLPMVADGTDPEYAQQVLRLFERTVVQTLDTIEAGVNAHDLTGVQRGVHSLKSSAGQVGALALAAEAARIENTLRGGGIDGTALRPMLQRLNAAQQRFAAAVAAVQRAG